MLILVKKDIIVEEVVYGDGMEVIMGYLRAAKTKIIVTYISTKTNAWNTNEHTKMQEEVCK